MRKTWIVLAVVAVVVLGAALLTPIVVRSQLASVLSEQAGREVTVASVTLSFTSGVMTVSGVSAGPDMEIGLVTVDVHIPALFGREVRIEQLRVERSRIALMFSNDGVLQEAGGIPLPAAPEPAATQSAAEEEEEEAAAGWTFEVRSVELIEVALALQPWQHDVELARVSVQTDGVMSKPLEIEAALKLDGYPVTFEGEASVVDRRVSGLLTVTNLEVSRYLAHAGISGQGLLTLNQRVDAAFAGPFTVTTEGSVAVEDAKTSDPVSVEVGALAWNGTVDVGEGPDALEVQARGDASVARLMAAGLVKAERIELTGLNFTPARTSLGALRISAPHFTVERDQDGAISGLPASEGDAGEAPGSEATVLPAVLIKTLTLEGGALTFNDLSVAPPVQVALHDIGVTAQGVTLDKPFPFQLAARHRDGGEPAEHGLKLAGDLDPGALGGTLELDLDHFELHQIGAYLGAEVQRGRLSLDTSGSIGDAIKLDNKILIEGLKAKAGPGSGDGLSLALALALLEDRKGRIELEVPIEVERGELEVGLQDVLSRAVRNAGAKAATTYATFALQPLGGLVLARDLAGKLMQPRFEAISFEPGSADLAADAFAYLDKVAKLLTDRPGLALSVCGVAGDDEVLPVPETAAATPADVAALPADGEALLALAQGRGAAVRAALFERGAAADQVFECSPRVGAGEAPQVTLLL